MDPTADQGDPCQGGGVPDAPAPPADGPAVIDNSPGNAIDLSNCGTDPTALGCQLAVNAGRPTGACQQTDGSNSLAVGTTVGSVNKNGVLSVRSVIDVNAVNSVASVTVINNQTVAATWAPVGWIYLDNSGGLWFQKDPATNWTPQFNANIGAYFGIGLTPPNLELPVYIKSRPTALPINSNLEVSKCWMNGRALAPGAVYT
jgi:hypothetical protein